jgi:hypothetical protein
VFVDFFIVAITGMIVLAALRRALRPSIARADPIQAALPETLTRSADGSVIDPEADARMRQAFNGLNSNLSFLGGQESWDLGPPPPVAELEADMGAHQQILSAAELAALQPMANRSTK